MPGFNQTGPMGQGPMTGRGRGVCTTNQAGFGTSSTGSPGFGRGMGFRRGFRRGPGFGGIGYRGRGWWADPFAIPQSNMTSLQNEIDMLHEQAESMQHSLSEISQRVAEMEKGE